MFPNDGDMELTEVVTDFHSLLRSQNSPWELDKFTLEFNKTTENYTKYLVDFAHLFFGK